MTEKTEQYQIRKGRTEIDVPHKDSDLTFVYEKHGPGTYANVASSIGKAGLSQPTMAETASFLHPVFTAKEEQPEFNEIKQLMRSNWLWAFTGSLYTPKGVYVQDNPAIKDGMPYMNESELVKKLEANDPSVRFVPNGFNIGEMSTIELAKNAYVKALAGDEGADKLAEIADKHKNKPYLWALKDVGKQETRVSALNSYWDVGHWLVVCGYIHGYYRYSCAFGVRKGGIGTVGSDASRAKK